MGSGFVHHVDGGITLASSLSRETDPVQRMIMIDIVRQKRMIMER